MAALPAIGGLDAAVGHKRSRPDDWDARLLEVVDDQGGITDSADGGRVVALFTEAREEAQQELACEALQRTAPGSATLMRLVKVGILTPLRDWLKAASSAMNKSSILAVLKALRHLPVDIASLKASKVGQYVAKLSERQNASGVAGVDRGIVSLANEIYDMWAAAASGKSTAAAGSASSSSSSSSAGAGADGKKEKDREKEREKDKGSDAKRQRREAPSSSSGASDAPRSSSLPLPPPVSLTALSGRGAAPAPAPGTGSAGGSGSGAAASPYAFPSLTSLASVPVDDGRSSAAAAGAAAAAAGTGAGSADGSNGPLPVSLLDQGGDGAAALAAALDASTAGGGDEDDWGYGMPPAPHEDGEPGMSPEEMGGLMKVRGEGLPDRFGRVPGGLLKNKVLGIAGGKPLGARERKSIVAEVAGAGAAAVLAASAAATAGGKRSVAWIDTLPAQTARAAHERIPKASADAFQASHLVAVKFFKKDAEPIRVSSAAGAGAGAGASRLGESVDRGSSERQMGAAGALAAAAAGAGLGGAGAGAGEEGESEGRHSSFREQLKAEKAREHESVRAALRASGAGAAGSGRLLVGGGNVIQGGQPGLYLFHAAPHRMVPLLAPTPLRGRGAAAFSPEAAAAVGVPPAGAWACASTLRAAQPVALPASVADKASKRAEAAARAASDSILGKAVQWRTESIPPVRYPSRGAIPSMPPVEPDASLEAVVAAAGPAGAAPPRVLTGLPSAPRPHMLPPRAPTRPGAAGGAGGAPGAAPAPAASSSSSVGGAGAVPSAAVGGASAAGGGGGIPASVAGIAASISMAPTPAAGPPSKMASLLSSLKSMASGPMPAPGPAPVTAAPMPVPAAPPAYGAPTGLQHVAQAQPLPAHMQHVPQPQPQPQPQLVYAPAPATAPSVAGAYGPIPVHAAHSAPAPVPALGSHYYQQVPVHAPAPATSVSGGLPPGAVLVAAPPPGAVPVAMPMHQPHTHAQYGHAPAPVLSHAHAYGGAGGGAGAYGGAGAGAGSGSLLPPPGHALVPVGIAAPPSGGGLLPTTGAPYGAPQAVGSTGALGAPPPAGSGRRFPAMNKPCLFFNTRVGCRKGSSCAFVHDPKYIPTLEELQGIASSERGLERARETSRISGGGGAGYAGGGRPGL